MKTGIRKMLAVCLAGACLTTLIAACGGGGDANSNVNVNGGGSTPPIPTTTTTYVGKMSIPSGSYLPITLTVDSTGKVAAISGDPSGLHTDYTGIAAVNGSGYSFSTTSSSGGYTIAGTISSLSSSGTVSGTANVGANTYSVSASASTTPVSSSFAGLYTGTIWTGSTTNNGGVYGATAVQDRSSTYIVFTHNYNYQYVLDKNGDLLRFRSSDGKMIYPSGYVSSSFYIDSSSNFYYISPSTNTALLRGKVAYTGQPGTGNLIASLIDTLGFYVDVDESLLKVSYPGDTIPACPYTLSLSVDNYGNVTGTVSISSAINGGKPFIIGGAGTVSSAGVFNFTASNTFDTSFSTSYSGSISTAGVVTGTYTFNAGAGSRNINALKQSSTTYVAPVSGVAPVVIKNSSGFEGDPTGNGGGS